MTTAEMQLIFESTLQIIITIFCIGYGIGMIIKLLKSATDN